MRMPVILPRSVVEDKALFTFQSRPLYSIHSRNNCVRSKVTAMVYRQLHDELRTVSHRACIHHHRDTSLHCPGPHNPRHGTRNSLAEFSSASFHLDGPPRRSPPGYRSGSNFFAREAVRFVGYHPASPGRAWPGRHVRWSSPANPRPRRGTGSPRRGLRSSREGGPEIRIHHVPA